MSSGSFLRRPAVLLALCLCSVGAVVTLLGRLANGPAVALKKTELNNETGAKAYPVFSPDGKRLAYSGRGTTVKDDAFHIMVRDLPDGAPRQLTSDAASDLSPAWSPDGSRLAFVRVSEEASECVIIPAVGPGEPRRFPGCGAPGDDTRPLPALTWTSDGKSLVVVQVPKRPVSEAAPKRKFDEKTGQPVVDPQQQPSNLAVLSIDSGAMVAITHPPAGTDGDSTPVVAPDGNTLAFVRGTSNSNGDIYLSDVSGANPRRLTFDDRAIVGLSWTRDGQDLMYTANRAAGRRIWRLPAYGGSPRDLIIAGRQAQYVSVAPTGGRLVYTMSSTVSAIWRGALTTPSRPGDEHAVIRSSARETVPRYSPDGKRIANISDQTGNDEIWISDADGSNRIRVTDLKGPDLARVRWSPDSKMLIFDASGEHGQELYTVPAVANGKPIRVQLDAMNGSWSHDGKSIYFQARNSIWKSSADGGSPQSLTQVSGAAQPVESPDGKWVYFRSRRTFWRVPPGGGESEEIIVPEHDLLWSTTIQVTKTGLYYLEFERSSREMAVSFYDFAEKKSSVVYRLKDAEYQNTTYSISPDGKSILYPRVDQSQTNLVIVENFR